MIDYIVVPLSQILNSSKIEENILVEEFKKFSCNLEKDLEDFLNIKLLHMNVAHLVGHFYF